VGSSNNRSFGALMKALAKTRAPACPVEGNTAICLKLDEIEFIHEKIDSLFGRLHSVQIGEYF